MSKGRPKPSIADRAGQVADSLERIANAAAGDRAAATVLEELGESPRQIEDQIWYDMLHVVAWIKRRRQLDTAEELRARVDAVVTRMYTVPQLEPGSGAAIIGLFFEARQLAYELRNWANDIAADESTAGRGSAGEAAAGRVGGVGPGTAEPLAPAKYLLSWPEILLALDLDNNDLNRDRVKRMNDLYRGPIILPDQGGQPKVNKAKLIEWWNGLEILWMTQANPEGAQASAANRHNFGKTGEAVPEIGGGVKKRRPRT
jgi:hypothetical protein